MTQTTILGRVVDETWVVCDGEAESFKVIVRRCGGLVERR